MDMTDRGLLALASSRAARSDLFGLRLGVRSGVRSTPETDGGL
jgi:hypothetical protein